MMIRRFGNEIVIETPAKLNLFLEVLAKRPDGFHELETLMVAINLYDSLLFSPSHDGVQVDCAWASGLAARWTTSGSMAGPSPLDNLPSGEDNLVYRAIRRLAAETGCTSGLHVKIIKRIPSSAGLGGASSDAAAALVAANQLWNTGLDCRQLQQIAAALGSDLPFFLANSTMAVGRGRGERLEILPRAGMLHFVVVRPLEGLSTPLVFRHCRPAVNPRNIEPIRSALQAGRIADVGRAFHNQLQPAAREISPCVRQLEREMATLGFLGSQMSGSGTTFFGLCRSARHAQHLAQRIRQRGIGVAFATHTEFQNGATPFPRYFGSRLPLPH